jgi:PAS domain S-box-containing protein
MSVPTVAAVGDPAWSIPDGGEMGARIRTFDWHKTSLGARDQWSSALQAALRIVLTTQHPMFIFWGPERRCFYNDAYAHALGLEEGSAMLGARGSEAWESIWDEIGPRIHHVMTGQGAAWRDIHKVPIVRRGRSEEMHWISSYSPIEDASAPNGTGGVLVVCSDMTSQVLAERRLAFLVRLDDALRLLLDAREIVATATEALGCHLGVSRIGYGEVTPDATTILVETNYTDGIEPLVGEFTLDGFWGSDIACQREGETLVQSDWSPAPAHERTAHVRIETRALVAVPIVRMGEFRASLFVGDRGPRLWSAQDVALIESVAARIWGAVERVQAQNVLRQSEAKYRLLTESIVDAVTAVDRDLRYIYWNKAAHESTGVSAEQALGRSRVEIFGNGDAVRLGNEKIRECIAMAKPVDYELEVPFLGPAWFHIMLYPTTDGVLTISRDITARKQAEEKLRKSEAALREADVRKDVFLATLSHELRNPLAPIRTAARLLESTLAKPTDTRRAQSIISRQAAHMAALLDDLLDVSRITRGMLTLKKEFVPLQLVLDAAVEIAQPLIEAKNHTFRVDRPASHVTLEADSVRLTQSVGNILANAAKYTNPGGEITLGWRLESESLVIFVRDTGVGLAPEMCEKVFEMFTQVEPDTGRKGGLGIGLALAKGLVELHGGRIQARSAGRDQGCEFTITLPRSLVEVGAAPAVAGSEGELNGGSLYRVLIADDNQDAAETLAMLLRMSGHEVHVAHDGDDALALASRLQPHIAVLDIGMPNLSGYEVAKRIRGEVWGEPMTLIAVTGWGQEEDRRLARSAGFDYHLTKPVDPVSLEKLFRNRTLPSSSLF